MFELPEDHAEVMMTALIIDGTTLIPARVAAITKGDSEAVPVEALSLGSLEGTTRPTIKIEITERKRSAIKRKHLFSPLELTYRRKPIYE